MGIRIDDSAVIDGSGLENVEMSAMRNQATISSVKSNELADPNYRAGFLNGASRANRAASISAHVTCLQD